MDNNFLKQLNDFLGRAALATYAGGGSYSKSSSRLGHYDLEYREGDWRYHDSYAGHFHSWGQEIIWYQDKPVWTQLYGGGLELSFKGDKKFAHKTFNFLKRALSQGEKSASFQPRGPKSFKVDDREYKCKWKGDIKKFSGSELINQKGEVVFKHNFFGGIFEGE